MSGTILPTMCQVLVGTQLRLKKCYAVLRARHNIAVTRPLVLRLLLRDHVQAAGVWKAVAGHTSLSTVLVYVDNIIQ